MQPIVSYTAALVKLSGSTDHDFLHEGERQKLAPTEKNPFDESYSYWASIQPTNICLTAISRQMWTNNKHFPFWGSSSENEHTRVRGTFHNGGSQAVVLIEVIVKDRELHRVVSGVHRFANGLVYPLVVKHGVLENGVQKSVIFVARNLHVQGILQPAMFDDQRVKENL